MAAMRASVPTTITLRHRAYLCRAGGDVASIWARSTPSISDATYTEPLGISPRLPDPRMHDLGIRGYLATDDAAFAIASASATIAGLLSSIITRAFMFSCSVMTRWSSAWSHRSLEPTSRASSGFCGGTRRDETAAGSASRAAGRSASAAAARTG